MTSADDGGCRLPRRCGCGTLFGQALPEFAELLMQFRVVQIAKTFACHHNNVQTRQQLLMVLEGILDQTFQAVALDGELDAFLADHQPQTRMLEIAGTCEEQDVLAWCLAAR